MRGGGYTYLWAGGYELICIKNYVGFQGNLTSSGLLTRFPVPGMMSSCRMGLKSN